MIAFVLVLFLFALVKAAVMTLPVEGRIEYPDGSPAINYELTLNGNQFTTLSRADGNFAFHDIPSGIYLLDVSSIKDVFPQMKIKVSAEEGKISALEYKYPGANKMVASYPVVLVALAKVTYFQQRPPFNIVSMLMANPMMLLMLFSAVMVVGFPKLLQGMTPEELEELKKQSAGSEDPMKKLSKLMGVAAKDDDEE